MRDLLVLCYHAVSPSWEAALSVSPDRFERQLRLLADHGWHGTTFTEAVLRSPARRTLAVTFDDAFGSVRELARPILERFGWPATVFVPTSFAYERRPLSWTGTSHWEETPWSDELLSMDWNDLGELMQAGWEIGTHTRTHPRLTSVNDDQLREELEGSREDCAEHLGVRPGSIAYPYGEVDGRVERETARAGYITAGRLSRDLGQQRPLYWPRVGIYNGDHDLRFRLKVSSTMRRLRASPVWPIH